MMKPAVNMKKRRRSVDLGDQEERPRKKKEPRVDRWIVPSSLERKLELCERLHEVLKGLKNEEGHSLTEFLSRVPSRRSAPDYYQVIERPIDLTRIQHKLKTGSYHGVSSFVADVQLLLNNARTFYKSSSIEYKSTKLIEDHFLSSLALYIESEDSLISPVSPKTVSLKLSNLPSNIPATSLSKSTPTLSKTTTNTPKATPTSSKATPTAITPKSSSTPALKPIKIKTTRSKAWLDSYIASDNPIKIYFANVYSYHDVTGEYVAQPFIEMPSRKDYPEYYQVIVEPIDLATIKANIDNEQYMNLRAIQDDMLLMIKNAHHFNEPGSAIYKMATSLRRYVINRCLELERHYKTVQVTQKKSPPPDEAGKSIKSPPPQGGKHTSKTRASSGDDSESGDELTDTESEDESGGATKKHRLLLKVKKEKLFGKEKNHLERVLKFKTQPKLKKLLQALYRTLVNAESEDKRLLSEMFMRRPSPKLYPEYYIVIANPIDFREISKKIREDQYKTLEDCMADVSLLVLNACTFNEENSQIHTDALLLQKIADSTHDQIKKKWGAPVAIATGSSHDDRPSVINSIKVLYLSIVNATDMTGRNLWHTFREPPVVSEGSEGVTTHKKCLGMSTISQKMEKGEYVSLDQLFSDLCTLFNAYCEVHPSNTQPYKDAVMLHRISVTKYNDLSRDLKLHHSYPNAQEEVKKLLKDIMKKTLQYKDDRGFVLSNSLRDIVVTLESHDKEDDAKSRRVFSMDKISTWVNNGRYTRLDQLQADIIHVLRKARESTDNDGDPGGKRLYKTSITLEKGYIQIRDKVCGHGGVLWSPALKRGINELVEEEERDTCSQREIKVDTDIEDMDTSNTGQILEPIPTVPHDKRSYHDKLIMKGVVYETGDYVYVPSKESHLPSQISLIESLWTDEHGNEWFDGCWFPHPHETYHVASRKFYEKEVFKSDFVCSNRLSKVEGKCCVLFIKDYIKYQPKGIPDCDVFVCESRYAFKQKQMKKIKTWNLPRNLSLIPREVGVSLTRVPSVFAINIDESVKSDRDSLEPSVERESVSEQMETNESFEASKDMSSLEESDVMEMSFFDDLKEVQATIPNPEENHTYYEQFCIDDKVFKLGDYVCVRSDQEHPYVARIDKMWTDNNGDPWFHGPWFVRKEEIVHLPTRMFYERELFLSNIQDTNPMRSIMRKCAVLGHNDYIKLRPTEVLEDDVFICESRYNEADKSIRRHKGLKVFQLNEKVLPNEIYYLQEELKIRKCHSHNLVNHTQPTQATPIIKPAASTSSKQVSVSSDAATPTSVATPTSKDSSNPVLSVPLSSGQLTLTLPQLQALIATQLTAASKSATPTPSLLTPPTIPQPHLQSQPSSSSGGTTQTIWAYPCTWGDCVDVFEDNVDLGIHIIKSNHIKAEPDGYYCYWKGCPRVKENGGKPFDTLQKITRHVKEVHMLRILAQKVAVDKLGSNYFRRGVFHKDTPLTETMPTPQQILQQATLVMNQSATPTSSSSGVGLSGAASTPVTTQTKTTPIPPPTVGASSSTSLTATSSIQATPTVNTTKKMTTTATQTGVTPPTQNEKSDTPPNVFISPPNNMQKVYHSQIYMNYIKRLRNNEPTISPLQTTPTRATPPDQPAPNPYQWIDRSCIPEGTTPIDALYKLRDYLIQDAFKIDRVLRNL